MVRARWSRKIRPSARSVMIRGAAEPSLARKRPQAEMPAFAHPPMPSCSVRMQGGGQFTSRIGTSSARANTFWEMLPMKNSLIPDSPRRPITTRS